MKNSESENSYLSHFLNSTAGLLAVSMFLLLGLSASGLAALTQLNSSGSPQKKFTLAEGADKNEATHSSALQPSNRSLFLRALGNALAAQGIKTKIFPENGLIRISAKSIIFPVGEAQLKPESLANFDRVSGVLLGALSCLNPTQGAAYQAAERMLPFAGPPCGTEAPQNFTCSPEFKNLSFSAIQIEGHADARPIAAGMFKDNLNLSSSRAETLLRRLQSCRPSLSQFANSKGTTLLNVAAHSTQQPAEKQNPTADANRRVEFRFLIEER